MKYRNSEGYADPTAGLAMSRVMKEYRQKQKKQFADKNRRKIYVASKYAGDVEKNTAFAVNCCRRVIDEGCMPIASHLLYPQMLDDNNPDEREMGLMFGLAAAVLFPGSLMQMLPNHGFIFNVAYLLAAISFGIAWWLCHQRKSCS